MHPCTWDVLPERPGKRIAWLSGLGVGVGSALPRCGERHRHILRVWVVTNGGWTGRVGWALASVQIDGIEVTSLNAKQIVAREEGG
ncbi:hypothetical protein HPP92_025767 [Vanilla planifolia]|uniref:Uncharacterized protein n=1 Tax=Vanilla planifolia TaxID=51239 RepID=A0A835PI49_VANPL|nr:hypothetical protein HPP92_025767 [Vanilla planifolia]